MANETRPPSPSRSRRSRSKTPPPPKAPDGTNITPIKRGDNGARVAGKGEPVPENMRPIAALLEDAAKMNNDQVRRAIKSHLEKMDGYVEARKALNQKLKLSREKVLSHGLDRDGLTAVEKFWNLKKKGEGARPLFDLTMLLGREAMGEPIQSQLFETIAETSKPPDKRH